MEFGHFPLNFPSPNTLFNTIPLFPLSDRMDGGEGRVVEGRKRSKRKVHYTRG